METEDKFYEKTLATTRTYTGKIVNVDVLDVELPDGRRAKREIVRRGNAVAILAQRPDGKFVFVKQYRKAAEQALIEVIAGMIEPGEDPLVAATRETADGPGAHGAGRRGRRPLPSFRLAREVSVRRMARRAMYPRRPRRVASERPHPHRPRRGRRSRRRATRTQKT